MAMVTMGIMTSPPPPPPPPAAPPQLYQSATAQTRARAPGNERSGRLLASGTAEGMQCGVGKA